VNRKTRFYFLSFLKYDFKASINVFFVALPLCLGISLVSNVPVYAGLIAGIIGGIVVSIISNSNLSVSGPAAGLTAICAAAIHELGAIEIFFLSVSIAGVLQFLLGALRLGGFTHFIPSSVIKGMLTAIGIILISKQVPVLIGYNKPDFWTNELFNIITFNHAFEKMGDLVSNISAGAIVITVCSVFLMIFWERSLAKRINFIPVSFVIVAFASLLAFLLGKYFPSIKLSDSQYVNLPKNILGQVKLPDFHLLFTNHAIWKNAILICFVATLETLLSIVAVDKLDQYNRVTSQNRELIAQGAGNFLSGLLGGIPITAVIVRSSANAEAGARTRLSAFTHGMWLLLVVLFAAPLVNLVPYSVLGVILVRTGFNLAKPKMILSVYKQGREQFFPFLITIIAILFTDLLIGVVIGIAYSIYFIIKHTYRAGYTLTEKNNGDIKHYIIELALNVSFLNKKRFLEMLDKIPAHSMVDIIGTKSIYIDNDVLEIFHDYRSKAHAKHIQLSMKDIPDVETIELH
jgi:MFS superfamily sulfate permease-like transporter